MRLEEFFSHCEHVAENAYREAFGTALRMREYRKTVLEQLTTDRISNRMSTIDDHLMLITPFATAASHITYRNYISKISQCIKFANRNDIIFTSIQGVLRQEDAWYVFVSIYDEPGLEQKLPKDDAWQLYRFISRPLMARSIIGSDISKSFEAAFSLKDDAVPVVVQEAWAYSLTTGFYAFDAYYDVVGVEG